MLSMIFRYFVIIPLGKRQTPSFEQTWIAFTQGYFVPSLVEISPVVLEKVKMGTLYKQKTDNRRSENLTWAFSSGELKLDLRV